MRAWPVVLTQFSFQRSSSTCAGWPMSFTCENNVGVGQVSWSSRRERFRRVAQRSSKRRGPRDDWTAQKSVRSLKSSRARKPGLSFWVTCSGGGGAPTSFDRVLATRFGGKAFELIQRRVFGVMVANRPPNLVAIPLADVVGKTKRVPLDLDLVHTALGLGVSFGD